MKNLFIILICSLFFISSCGIYDQQCEGVVINNTEK